jgi:CPA1 family monovalent cation:H+ antiporter
VNGLELILILLVVAAVLAVVAQRLKVPYPILLVIGGLGLAFVPGLPAAKMDPELVLLLFLPPLLFSAAWFTSWRDFRRQQAPDRAARHRPGRGHDRPRSRGSRTRLIPGMSWPVAFVRARSCRRPTPSPPPRSPSGSRFRAGSSPSWKVESLVNDATGLVAYSFALAAVSTGSFSLTHAPAASRSVAEGGVAVGLDVGWLVAQIHRRMETSSSRPSSPC